MVANDFLLVFMCHFLLRNSSNKFVKASLLFSFEVIKKPHGVVYSARLTVTNLTIMKRNNLWRTLSQRTYNILNRATVD